MRRIMLTVLLALSCVLILAPAVAPPSAQAESSSNTYLLRERLCLLQAYIERYANQHYSYYPTRSMVQRRGPLPAPLWPLNPWTGQAMVPGAALGDYTYTPAADLLSYRLSARSPGGSIVLTGSVPGTRKMQADHRTREGLELIQQYIEMWARDHDGLYPPVAEVSAERSVGRQDGIIYWPHDPWVHEPMKQSTARGDFTYEVSASRDSYSITAHYSRGGTFTLHGATATNPWHASRVTMTDEILKRDLDIIDGFVRLYASENAGALPGPEELTPSGSAGQVHTLWPIDFSSGEQFTPGDGVGHFVYTEGADGTYTLTAALAGTEQAYVVDGDVTPGVTTTVGVTASCASAALIFTDWNPPGR